VTCILGPKRGGEKTKAGWFSRSSVAKRGVAGSDVCVCSGAKKKKREGGGRLNLFRERKGGEK